MHIRYMPGLEWSALILAKRGCRRGQRLISWRVMINEHAQKLRVKQVITRISDSSACRLDPAGVDTNFYEPYPLGSAAPGARR